MAKITHPNVTLTHAKGSQSYLFTGPQCETDIVPHESGRGWKGFYHGPGGLQGRYWTYSGFWMSFKLAMKWAEEVAAGIRDYEDIQSPDCTIYR